MIIAWASTKNKLKFFRIERSFRTSLFVLEMTFKHLPPTQRNQATRRQPSCLAVDPGRCEFWRVQKNSAWGHRHLHNPPDIFPCNLIKLFTSLAPNYVDPAIHSLSINQPVSLNRIEPTNVTSPFRMANRRSKQRMVVSDTQRFQTNNIFPPLSTLFGISYCPGILFTFEEQSALRERERILSLEVHNLKTIGHYVQMMLSREVGCCSN